MSRGQALVRGGVRFDIIMNDAVYKFKRYEDVSLSYIGINKRQGEDVGLFDTVITAKDYLSTFENMAR
jgi:hypothetical protein